MKDRFMDQQDLSGQVAIVTGASSGLGRAAAKAFAQAGAVAVVNHPPKDSSREKAAAVVGEIEAAGGSAIAIAGRNARPPRLLSSHWPKAEGCGGLDRDARGKEGATDHAPVWIKLDRPR